MPIPNEKNNYFLRQTIKKQLKKLILLLLVGQVFFLGAVLQKKSDYIVEPEEVSVTQYVYDTTLTNDERLLLYLTEDQMPIPPAEKETRALVEKKAKSKIALNSFSFSSHDTFETLDLFFSDTFKIYKRNQGNTFVRCRVTPAIKHLPEDKLKKIKDNFDEFSVHYSAEYTEIVISVSGKIGTPYIKSSNNKILSIPFQRGKSAFPLMYGTKIAKGLFYFEDRLKTSSRTSQAHILQIKSYADSLEVLPVLANDGLAQKETLSSMAKRRKALAGINGAYFTAIGEPIGTLIINRHLISSPLYKRSVFGLTHNDTAIFGNPDFSGTLKTTTLSIPITAVNKPRLDDQLIIYTSAYAESTLTRTEGIELVIVRRRIVAIHSRDTFIPPDGVVISASGKFAKKLSSLRLGEIIDLDYSIDNPWNTIKHAVCGGPRLLADGEIDINGDEEKFSSSIVLGRHPRTAIGVTFDGDLIMIVVDGRNNMSAGATLTELASYLKGLGVRHAINLDGGGSSGMLINGKIVNKPSDGSERKISNALLLFERNQK